MVSSPPAAARYLHACVSTEEAREALAAGDGRCKGRGKVAHCLLRGCASKSGLDSGLILQYQLCEG